MTDKDLTDWFPGHVEPARHGVYQRLYGEGEEIEGPEYCLFDGVWRVYRETIKDAEKAEIISGFQNLRWRGLRKP